MKCGTIGLALLLAAGSWAQTTQRVEGRLIDATTGEGIRYAHFSLLPEGGRASSFGTAGEDGRFAANLPPGAYELAAGAPGYFDEPADPQGLFDAPPLVVTGGSKPLNVVRRLTRFSHVSGKVVDAHGRPVASAVVLASQSGVDVIRMTTGSDGRFDLFEGLFPGSYTLAVFPPHNLPPPDPEAGSDVPMAWGATYYPREANAETAPKLMLKPDAEIFGLEIKLLATPAHEVRGVLLDPKGAPAAKTRVKLARFSGPALHWAVEEEGPSPDFETVTGGDGSFVFSGVPESEWEVSAEVGEGVTATHASEWIDVGPRELAPLKLRLREPVVVAGSVDFQETEKPARVPVIRLLRRVGREQRFGPPFFVNPAYVQIPKATDFRFTHVTPGRYLIDVRNVDGYYVDSVRMGGAAIGPTIDIGPGAGLIEVVYKANPGRIRGEIKDCEHCWVMVFPRDPALRWDFPARNVSCDANGRFEIDSLRPGDYSAFAFRRDPDRPFWRPGYRESLDNQATTISVRLGETATVELRPVAAPPD